MRSFKGKPGHTRYEQPSWLIAQPILARLDSANIPPALAARTLF